MNGAPGAARIQARKFASDFSSAIGAPRTVAEPSRTEAGG